MNTMRRHTVLSLSCFLADLPAPILCHVFKQEGGSQGMSEAASSREVNGSGLLLASIVRGVVAASGVGCETIVTSSSSLADQQRCWTTRCSKYPTW